MPGLGGQDATGGCPEGMAAGVRALLEQMPDGSAGLAISHTPLVERAGFGLTGREVEPLRELEGILLTLDDDGRSRSRSSGSTATRPCRTRPGVPRTRR